MIVYKADSSKRQIVQKNLKNRKSKLVLSMHVNTTLSNIAFHLQLIWLQILVAMIRINSKWITFRIVANTVFCAPPSKVAVLLDLNQSRGPFLGQVVDLDLMLAQNSIWNMRYSYALF